jgi:eukaryotic-like serine/threonine-protein kinase
MFTEFLKVKSFKHVLIHFAIIASLLVGTLLVFFYVYLPSTTHHGETITVPNLQGMHIDELEKFLDSKNLRYQINDSSYSSEVKPLTVLSQHPLSGAKVKKDRKIYISVASLTPPKIKMPNLIDASLRSAEMTLKSYDLKLGDITYVPHFSTTVLKQQVDGKDILPNTYIAKGSKINLVIGNGSGSERISAPDLVGMDADEAKVLITGQGLHVGSERVDNTSNGKTGTITKQKPEAGKSINIGEMIDIWIAGE